MVEDRKLAAKVQMAHEIREASAAVRQQQQIMAQPLSELVRRLKRNPPQVIVTCARGSSAHAATFGKHLIELYMGIPVCEAAPNIASVYGKGLHLKNQLLLAISQSGRSDDLVELATSARVAGALTVAIVNATDGPLVGTCDIVLPIGAGPELSIAASKTFVASLAALVRLISTWRYDPILNGAIERLPDRLLSAAELNWSVLADALLGTDSLVTIGRGPTLAIAREAALKFKETCRLHAEAFSGAEFQHGPVALVASHYPILMFIPNDAAAHGMLQLATDLQEKGSALFTTGHAACSGCLSALPSDHPVTDAICLIQSFYSMLIGLAAQLGTNVDQPPHLHKVTRTR